MKFLAAIGGALALATSSAGQAQEAPKPVEVMVLGTYHFNNPGRDIHNMQADDVLKPQRQAEIEALAKALADFRPTKVMVERVAKTPDLADADYAAFTPETLKTERRERVQIGYRLARQLGHDRVYAIDESPDGDEPDYFPYGKVVEHAKANGQSAVLEKGERRGAEMVKAFAARQATATIPELLVEANAPDYFGGIGGYYDMLAIGDTERQPGAELNAVWYMRNAKIFAKLMTVAKPGDRILIVYGAGHNYWLRHFVSETPGYRNVDPTTYLRAAALK